MKPLIRWTVGPVDELGLQILETSIRKFIELYDFCDYLICHNNIDPSRLKRFNVPLFDQSEHLKSCPSPPFNELWKICPPRLRLESHEVVIDNDLIIVKRVPQIDDFFNKDSTLLLAGGSNKRYYGQYDKYVPEGLIINSGIYGMPPGFDFSAKIFTLCGANTAWTQNRSEGLFDDQGVVTACLATINSIIIPPSQILNCDKSYTKQVNVANGYHFIDANRGNSEYWDEFMRSGFRKIY